MTTHAVINPGPIRWYQGCPAEAGGKAGSFMIGLSFFALQSESGSEKQGVISHLPQQPQKMRSRYNIVTKNIVPLDT
jgi:hypothetical protein